MSSNLWLAEEMIHPDLLAAKKLIYDLNNFSCASVQKDAESADYGAFTFVLNHSSILFRVAKITPTKIGQFVTIWKRTAHDGKIKPFHINDSIDFFVISTRKDNAFGQFVFPKAILCEHGIIESEGKKGKLGIRVYPPWDIALNKQAQKTQKWQLKYFLEISLDKQINNSLVRKMYTL